MKTYSVYEKPNITKELLNTIKVGDLIKINTWKKPMRVVGVSENYFIMRHKLFNDTYYSICEKNKRGYEHNMCYRPSSGFMADEFVCGHDDHYGAYNYCNDEEVLRALDALEKGELGVTTRYGLGIYHIEIKGA